LSLTWIKFRGSSKAAGAQPRPDAHRLKGGKIIHYQVIVGQRLDSEDSAPGERSGEYQDSRETGPILKTRAWKTRAGSLTLCTALLLPKQGSRLPDSDPVFWSHIQPQAGSGDGAR
jgi:hypothetical protein